MIFTSAQVYKLNRMCNAYKYDCVFRYSMPTHISISNYSINNRKTKTIIIIVLCAMHNFWGNKNKFSCTTAWASYFYDWHLPFHPLHNRWKILFLIGFGMNRIHIIIRVRSERLSGYSRLCEKLNGAGI